MNYKEFTSLLLEAEIIDPRYPIMGCYVWMPYGYKIRKNVLDFFREKMDENGYEEYLFPRLVPEKEIKKVTENIGSFEEGVFWVTHAGKKELSERLFLNPTGECGVYPMFEQWVRTENDLPLRAYQIASTFRPHRDSNPMLNGNELTSLMEAHGAHASKEEAWSEFQNVLEFMDTIHERMGIPYIKMKRPVWGNKPVSEVMVSYETYMPAKGRSFNVGVAYHQDQIYSRAFDISFNNRHGDKEHTHQNTFGISERGIAAMLSLHLDDNGLCLMPEFAPHQVVLIPFYKKEDDAATKERVVSHAKAVRDMIPDYRSIVDENSKPHATKKIGMWRKKGIPLRLGIGVDEIETGNVKVLRRDTDRIEEIPIDRLPELTGKYMKEIQRGLYDEARDTLSSHLHDVKTLPEMVDVSDSGDIAKFNWCGEMECGQGIENRITGEILGQSLEEEGTGECISCGNEGNLSYYGKRCATP